MALTVGLTGGIASGKSLVSKYLKELGAAIIDADELARNVVEPHSPACREIREYFGSGVFEADGNINRRKLAGLVFSSKIEREKLNSIIHPRVIGASMKMKEQYLNEKKAPLIVIDAPLLIETGMYKYVDEVWVIAVPEEVQLDRLMMRDKLSQQEANSRLESQMPLEEKLRYADRVIDNSDDVEKTRQQVDLLWRQVVGR